MEELLPMTGINDFLFCPRFLCYGNIFRRSLGKDAFQQTPQKKGLVAHRTVDEGPDDACVAKFGYPMDDDGDLVLR